MVTGAPMRMNMGPPPMPTDPRLLTLVQWLSPAYPVGGFAWSHGLETAIAQGWIRDATGLQDWLADLLTQGSGRADVVLIGLAHATKDHNLLTQLNATALAFAPAAERRRESLRQGAAFARITRELWQLDLPDWVLPVALGHAARLMAMALEDVAALYLHSFATNLTAAAQRLMPLGQTKAQSVLRDLTPTCCAVAKSALTATGEDLWSHCFLSDIAAMQHETQQPRLFQS